MMPPDSPPGTTPVRQQQVTAEQLAYYLFGNPLNPQDKGIIGTMQDQVKSLIRLGWALFLVFLTAIATLIIDIISRGH